MEQVMTIPRNEINYSETLQKMRLFAKELWRWLIAGLRGIFSALFVPSQADRQIEESRERVRQLMMRSY